MREAVRGRFGWIRRHPTGVAAALCLMVAAICLHHLLKNPPPWTLERLWQRHAQLKPAKLDDYVAYGFWVGAAVAGAISLLLAATARWWARPPTGNVVPVTAQHEPAVRRFWLWLAIALLVATAFRAPRMDHALWGDEGWAYRDLMGGRYTQLEDGSLDYRTHDWGMTLFWDKGLNNQYLFSIAARACNDLWRNLSGAPEHAFSESALRVPALLAGLLSIVAFALLLRQLGFARSGVTLAFLLAVHPWHIRYSVEARSYTMLILGLALALISLANALSTDRRRWWLAFAAAEFASLYAWKAAIHPYIAIHLVAAGVLLVKLRGAAFVPVMRSLAAGGIALAAFISLFAPAIPQIALALEKSALMKAPFGTAWSKDVWAQMVAAMDWGGTLGDSTYQTLVGMAAEHPVLVYGILVVLVPTLCLLGLVRLASRSTAACALLIAPLLGGLLAIAHFKMNGTFMHKWYISYANCFVFALAAIGACSLRPALLPTRFAPAAAACFVVAYFFTTAPQSFSLVRLPLSETRQATEVTRTIDEGRGTLAPSDHITVGVYRRVTVYDPRMIGTFEGSRIRDAATLRRVLEYADANGKTLAVTASNLGYARVAHADLFELLDDETLFEPLGLLPAIEPYIRIENWRYRPGSIASKP